MAKPSKAMTEYVGVPPDFTYIYALRCPLTDEIRYIGKADKPIERLARHRGATVTRSNKSPVRRWVSALRRSGKKPNMSILSACPHSSWQAWEKWWIAKAKKDGAQLLNVGSGGNGSDGVDYWGPATNHG